jgi:AcrR family transcriptional regulator
MTKKLPKEERRTTIVNAAMEEFLEKGFERASMEAIANRAGISKGGVYHHFKNKDEVLLYATRVFTVPVERMTDRLAGSKPVAEGLGNYISEYVNHWITHPKELRFYFLSMNKAFQDKALIESYENYTGQILGFFEKLFQSGIDSGEFQALNTKQTAFSFISAIDGSLAYILLDKSLDADFVIASLKEIFIEKLKIRTF